MDLRVHDAPGGAAVLVRLAADRGDDEPGDEQRGDGLASRQVVVVVSVVPVVQLLTA